MQFAMMTILSRLMFAALLLLPLMSGASVALVVGDSLSAAHNIPVDQSWPVLFQQKLGQHSHNIKVVNASISGETSHGAASRLPDLLEKHHPAYLVIELGGNDGLRGYSFDDTRKNLAEMINMAQARDLRVLLIGVRLPPNLGPVYNQRFQQVFEAIAEQYKVAYLPRFLEGVAADKPEYMQADGIHPTALAQPILAEKVFTSFSQAFLP